MAHDLRALLGPDGVARTAQLTHRVDRHSVDRWVRDGRLLRPHPGVVALPASFDAWRTRALAAVLAASGALSHTSALTVWRLAPETDPVHVAVPPGRHALRRPGLVVHRAQDVGADRIGPYAVTGLPRALADTWGLAHGSVSRRRLVEVARGAVITALRDGRVQVDQLRSEQLRRPALPGRAALGHLVDLVEGGCQSELEIWGVHRVLLGPELPRIVQQHPVRLPFATVHLDAAVPELRVAIELDGAAFHGSATQRERDTRRDVALAALGWVVLRFSYRRLTTEPAACRREVIQVCAARRALLLPQ